MKEPDADMDKIDAEAFSALPNDRKVEIIGELLKRGDFAAIDALGVKIMTDEEWVAAKADEPPDVIEIQNTN